MAFERESLAYRVHQQILEAAPYAALEDIYHSIKQVFPPDHIYVVHFDPDRRLMRILAQASGIGTEKTDFLFEDLPDLILEPFKQKNIPPVYIINEPSTDVVGNYIYNRGKGANWSGVNINFTEKASGYGTFFSSPRAPTKTQKNIPAC